MLVYILGNFLRAVETPEPIKNWLPTDLKDKTDLDRCSGHQSRRHDRYVASQLAEVAISRNLFADVLRLIAKLRPPPDGAPA